jgi:hypothetical protein
MACNSQPFVWVAMPMLMREASEIPTKAALSAELLRDR